LALLFWLLATAGRNVLIPASKGTPSVGRTPLGALTAQQFNRGLRRMARRKNTGCHEFHAKSRYTILRPVFTI
jgi:hypothetical protein